jgi:hypothetical protein
MGNFKQGSWSGSLVYLTFMTALGLIVFYFGPRLIQQISPTLGTFIFLIYTAFVFFWDGTFLLGEAGSSSYVHANGKATTDKK